jgi:ABC-type spermidine/putrescine transport system permease subunit II
LPALGEQMNVAIVLALAAIVLATAAALALVRNGGAE